MTFRMLMLLLGLASGQDLETARAEPLDVIVSEQGSGRATGYAETNKIITWRGKTHVAWLDSEEGAFPVRIRTLDHQTQRWSEVRTIGGAADNHGGPALTIDGEGYLHVVFYPHHHPMRYRRSLNPNDASAWTEVTEVGERATYPTLVCGPDGTLILTCRESRSEEPWVVRLYRKPPGEPWSKGQTILRSEHKGYSHFQEALAWGPDHETLHLSCRIYSGKPVRGHTVGYLVSRDFGRTWTRRDGEAVTLPATAKTVDVIASEPEGASIGLRCGTLAVDGSGRPWVIYSSYDSRPPRAFLSTPGESGWRREELTLPPEYEGWGLNLPGGLAFDDQGRLQAVLTMMRPAPESEETLWGHPTSEIVLLEWKTEGASPSVRALTEMRLDRPRWLPNLERPTGFNEIGTPSLLYTDGERGEKLTDMLSNGVHWVRLVR
ncbi:MAG: BNR-4 repeat-containing protein [Planctomycetota bacterium]